MQREPTEGVGGLPNIKRWGVQVVALLKVVFNVSYNSGRV